MENMVNVEMFWPSDRAEDRGGLYPIHVAPLSAASRRRERKGAEATVAAHASGTKERSWKFSAVSQLSVPVCVSCSGSDVIVGMKHISAVLFYTVGMHFYFLPRVLVLHPFFPILWLIETQIAAEETARRLITVLCNEADGRRRPTSDCCERHPAAPDIKANTDI